MMQLGFLMDFILFVVPAFHFNYYKSTRGVHAFQAMYFLSSFFNQFGPNCVTFLVAAEVYPTSIRATAHGFSAAWGKLGALLATVVYNYIGTQTKFYFVPWFGLAGMVVTYLFLPDTTGLDLKEQERRWMYLRQGREAEYHGIAVHPRHLSVWERWTGAGKYYDPKQDRIDQIRDLRDEWVYRQSEKSKDEASAGLVDIDDQQFPDDMHNHFMSTSPGAPNKLRETSSDETSNEKATVN